MRVDLRQSGGVANLRRQILVEGNHLAVIDKGKVKSERLLQPEECESITGLVQQIERLEPKRVYGRSLVSDPVRTVLSVEQNSYITKVEASTDPSDPLPEEVLALVRQLYQLASALS